MEARGSYVITDLSPVQRDFWDLVLVHGVTDFRLCPSFSTPSSACIFIGNSGPIGLRDTGGWPSFTSCHKAFQNPFAPYDISYFTMYGATEASPRIAYLHPDDAEAKHGSVGKPISIGTVTLDGADPDTSEVNLSITGQMSASAMPQGARTLPEVMILPAYCGQATWHALTTTGSSSSPVG